MHDASFRRSSLWMDSRTVSNLAGKRIIDLTLSAAYFFPSCSLQNIPPVDGGLKTVVDFLLPPPPPPYIAKGPAASCWYLWKHFSAFVSSPHRTFPTQSKDIKTIFTLQCVQVVYKRLICRHLAGGGDLCAGKKIKWTASYFMLLVAAVFPLRERKKPEVPQQRGMKILLTFSCRLRIKGILFTFFPRLCQ